MEKAWLWVREGFYSIWDGFGSWISRIVHLTCFTTVPKSRRKQVEKDFWPLERKDPPLAIIDASNHLRSIVSPDKHIPKQSMNESGYFFFFNAEAPKKLKNLLVIKIEKIKTTKCVCAYRSRFFLLASSRWKPTEGKNHHEECTNAEKKQLLCQVSSQRGFHGSEQCMFRLKPIIVVSFIDSLNRCPWLWTTWECSYIIWRLSLVSIESNRTMWQNNINDHRSCVYAFSLFFRFCAEAQSEL